MTFHSFGRSVPLLAALAAFTDCGAEKSVGTPDDAGDTDTGGCECSSPNDNYCSGSNYAMQCDGCHFSEQECWCADCASCCTDGECIPSGCDDTPECESENDNYCTDGSTLMECQVFDDEWDNYYEEVNCADPVLCSGDGGCALNDDGIAACWCDESDGGVGDAGVDAGV